MQKHRDRMKSIDPYHRYFTDAVREILRAYAQVSVVITREKVMYILRCAATDLIDAVLVRAEVRKLVQQARRDRDRQLQALEKNNSRNRNGLGKEARS